MAKPNSRKELLQLSLSICSEMSKENDIWELVEGYAMRDQIDMLVMISPKYRVVNTIGFLKGKSAIWIFRDYLRMKRDFVGQHFWARGYCVSTVCLDEQMIREYIRNQEKEE